MAERKVDPSRIAQPKPATEARGAKGDAPDVHGDDKELVGFLDESKDQLTSDNSIPLSPQWLYSKHAESKASNSAALGDTRLPNSLSYGISADSVQKGSWRLDGPLGKKEWRRNVPDVENSFRWRDEERDTGLLARRERMKDVDRESEYRKNDRRTENVSKRDSSESGNLPSDRWHEATGRNTGHENRRDSKWSSRWGPEDKEKDSLVDRKLDAKKEDHSAEKQSFLGSNRPMESDTRDKWRPRHRQEINSGGSTAHRAAPGFGLDRGRPEASHVGFVIGRGRGSLLGDLSQPRLSSVGPLGAAFVTGSQVAHGKSGLFAQTFRYPRGRLLDIYRKHKALPDFNSVPDGLDVAPPLTQSKSVAPLAFIPPDADVQALLEDISKGKVTGSGISYITNKEWNAKMDSDEINPARVEFGTIPNTLCCDSKVDVMASEASDHDVRDHCQMEQKQYTCEKNEVKDAECFQHSFMDSVIDGTMPAVAYDASSKLPDESSYEVYNYENNEVKHLEMNSNEELSLFYRDPRGDIQGPFLGVENNEVKHLEMNSNEELSLFYRDPQGDIQGPFLGVDIISWLEQGFFGMDLPVCLSDVPEGTPFRPLGEVMPNLKLGSSFTAEIYSSELSGHSDGAIDNFETNGSLASSFGGSFDTSGQRLTTETESKVVHQVQHKILELRGYSGPLSERAQFSELETSGNIPFSESQALHDFTGQDTEEVLYRGRHMNGIEKPLEKLANDDHDISCLSIHNQFPTCEVAQPPEANHKDSTDKDMHPLGLLWSELDGTNARRPISSNVASIHDQIQNANPFKVVDSPLIVPNQEQFSSMINHPAAHDLWPGTSIKSNKSNIASLYDQVQNANPFKGVDSPLYVHELEQFSSLIKHPATHDLWPGTSIRSNKSNVSQDVIDAGNFPYNDAEPNFPYNEAEPNHIGLEDRLLSQQFKNHQLQKYLPSPHQKKHLSAPFTGPIQSSVHHTSNQPMLNFEYLLELQLQEQHHLQQLREQQHLEQQQQQLHHQIQLLQQQHQQQQQQQQKEQQQQMLFEHLLRHQLHDPSFAASHVDPLLGSSSLDQILLRRHLLHDLERQHPHPQMHQDPIMEQLMQVKLGHDLHNEHGNNMLDVLSHQKHRSSLSMEEQILLRVQQDQLLGRQFPLASSQRVMEEDRLVGSAWSVDEAGQFIRTAPSPHQARLNRQNQLDFVQSLQQPSSFEQANILERNLMLQEHMKRSAYETNMHPFDRTIPLSPGPPGSNEDVINALARIQGLDMPGTQGHVYPSILANQFHPVNSSNEHLISNQLFKPHLDVMDSQWVESNGHLPNKLVEAQLNQLHFEAEKQMRDMRGSLLNSYSNTWTAHGSKENSKHGIDELLQQKLVLKPSHPLEFVDTAVPSFKDQDSSWFTYSPLDNSFMVATENAVSYDSLTEASNLNKLVYMQQDGMVNADMERQSSNYGTSGRRALCSRSSLSFEQNQLLPETDENEKKQLAEPVGNDSSRYMIDLSDTKDGKRSRKLGLKGKALSNADQAGGFLPDHAEVKANAPVRHASLGSNASVVNFCNYEMGMDNVYSEEMTNSRSLGILDRSTDSCSLKLAQDPRASLVEFVSAPTIKGKSPFFFLLSEGRRETAGGTHSPLVPGASPSGAPKDTNFCRSSSADADSAFIDITKSTRKPITEYEVSTDADSAFIDITKSTRKPTAEYEVHAAGANDVSELGHGAKSGKKKGKKGRQIDPSLLGFKVHSNRIMMGEIQRPHD